MKCPKCHSDNPSDSSFCAKCGTQIHPSSEEFLGGPTETLKTSIKELTTGSTFAGRYQVIEELGKGGMGRVYKVFDTKVKEKVALKLIKPDIASDKETIDRFSNELRLARKIGHRNVCRMFDMGEAERAHFITMEYVQGEDLKSMIRMMGQLSPGQIVSIGKQVCEGLAEAHRLGVVHRDLKPQNIMIDKGGNAKIMDFGIARSIREKGITGPSVLIGTPEYMSPEQAEAKEVDHRSDIYSLGIILYEMATGRVPFEGDTALSIAMKHKGEIPKNPKEFNSSIPDDLSGVILRCLEKDKAKRYQTAVALREELDKIEKGIPTTERMVPERKTPTSREITVKFMPKKLILPAAVLAVLVAAGLFFLLKPRAFDLDPKRVVVAPFENKTGDPKLDNIGFMASDWITQGLMQTNAIAVSSLPATDALKDIKEEKDKIQLVARSTRAGKVVTGSYYLEGETMRFAAQVQDARQVKLLMAVEPASGAAKEPAKIIEALRQKVMVVLATVLNTNLPLSYFGYIPTYEAYTAYMEGLQSYNRNNYRKAIEFYDNAMKLDSNFLDPLIPIASSYLSLGQLAKAEEFQKKAEESKEKFSPVFRIFLEHQRANINGDRVGVYRTAKSMFELDPVNSVYSVGWSAVLINRPREAIKVFKTANPEAIMVKDWLSFWSVYSGAYHMLGEHKDELKVARRARKYYPDRHGALGLEIRALAAMGKIGEVNLLIEESQRLPPESGADLRSYLFAAGRELRAHGYRKESLEFMERAIQWLKDRPDSERKAAAYRSNMANCLYWAERWDEAKADYEALAKEFPENLGYRSLLGIIAARMGNREEAQRISDELGKVEQPYLYGLIPYYQARIAALLGSKDKAVKLLQESVAQGGVFGAGGRYDAYMEWEALADYPPFKEFIKPKG